MKDNNEIFKGKTFQDLTKDIYENTTNKKKKIDLSVEGQGRGLLNFNLSDLQTCVPLDNNESTTNKKKQIDLLISEIHGFITTIDDVVMVAPIIKEYMEVSVKNDEHLVKLAGVLQRIISKSSSGDEESMLLSDSEKDELMATLQDTVQDLEKEQSRLEGIKNKTIDLGN